MKKPAKGRPDPNREAFQTAVKLLEKAPGIGRPAGQAWIYWEDKRPFPREGWAIVNPDGEVYANAKKRGTPQEWLYILAHCVLHLALGHFVSEREADLLWNAACDCIVARMLSELHIGTPPAELSWPIPGNTREERLYQWLKEHDEAEYHRFSIMGEACPDMDWTVSPRHKWRGQVDWQKEFAQGLRDSVLKAVSQAGELSYEGPQKFPPAEKARGWFISSYPLLGAVAAGFTLLADAEMARRMEIPVAAVCPALGEIYINPLVRLEEEEWRFVLAHEFLHAALRHDVRREGRDPELWNVACDFLINGWLMEMGVGNIPEGVLYDPELKGMSAEAIYDQLCSDLRTWRKRARRDLIWEVPTERIGPGIDLDHYYHSALQQGLAYHQSQGRGYIPAGLVEEIRALSRPPISWDVELARWFDAHFQPLEKRRTYARLSRRQSSTPDIPRPAWYIPEEETDQRIYGVVLDTSGSMDRALLAAALGSIASYSVARNVEHVRVVFCDAHPYDQGVLHPESIAGSVQVRGRGGTILQPALDLLDRDPEFPKEAPLLIITDGDCDRLNLRGREHAYLIPKGNRLPFPPRGPVFYLK